MNLLKLSSSTLKYLFFAFLIACNFIAKGYANPDTVTVNLGWYPQFQFAGYYAALYKGFYKEEGLIVNLKPFATAGNSIDAVISGENEYGVGTGSMLLGNPRVSDLVVLAAFQQQSPVTLVCLDNGRYERLKDFDGKYVVGGTEIRAMFLSAGVKPDSIGPPLDIPHITQLEAGQFDGMTMYITDLPILKGISETKFKLFKPTDYGINFYGECLFTCNKELTQHPSRVEKMISASIKGWEYALQHKEEIADLLVSQFGSKLTKKQLMEEANIVESSLVIPSLYEIGSMQKNKWSDMAKTLKILNILKEDINLDRFIYEKKSALSWPILEKFLIALSVLATLLTMGAIGLFFFNARLKKAVSKRTYELNTTLEKLNDSLKKEKHISDHLENLVNARTKIIEEQNKKLEHINADLEDRVKERTEFLSKANQELDMFIYSISHDIRAPLASIQGLINVIELHPESKDEYIKLIANNVKQLDYFIEEMLEYTRNTKRELHYEVIDMETLVNSVFDEIKFLPGAEGVSAILDIQNGVPVVTDRTRLFVVLRNIISNAVKYKDHNKNHSFVKVISVPQKEKVTITIEDNGVGISNEHLDKIYTMFYRANENSKGSGLGLFIVKEILDNMEGTIQARSEPRKGTTFRIEFANQSVDAVI